MTPRVKTGQCRATISGTRLTLVDGKADLLDERIAGRFRRDTRPLAGLGERGRGTPRLVQRTGAPDERIALWPAHVRVDVRVLANRRRGSHIVAGRGRVRRYLARNAEDRVLEQARVGRLQQPACARAAARRVGRPA